MFSNKTILVTGGTGSVGKKVVETLIGKYSPKGIIVFSRDEQKQYEMRKQGLDNACLRYRIGDIRDKESLWRAFDGVDIVIHSAALKHIISCEYNPFETVKTNVLGAQNIIDASIDRGVERVIALSTDKAANPTSIYGATKLCAEKMFIHGNSSSSGQVTRFSAVRFGNVIGSRGSVIPLFIKQRDSGVITVTDEKMTRFALDHERGVDFLLECAKTMEGGEVFIPKLSSMRIWDIAKAIAPDCSIEISGIQPGEKVHECLITVDEARHTLEFDDHYVIGPEFPWWDQKRSEGGRPLAEGFSYTSDLNDRWLTADRLLEIIGAP